MSPDAVPSAIADARFTVYCANLIARNLFSSRLLKEGDLSLSRCMYHTDLFICTYASSRQIKVRVTALMQAGAAIRRFGEAYADPFQNVLSTRFFLPGGTAVCQPAAAHQETALCYSTRLQ
ncbi:MAG: hypothetical protein PF501_03745 [Salinisphaera sp.]|nr:hypothetical protein [Salinisphaera sp.]